MNLGPLVLGALALAVVVVDLLWTTLWVEGGAGPLTTRSMGWTWRALRRVASGRPRALSLAGPLILAGSLTLWIALLWGGWTLLFAGAEDVLVDTRGAGPISWTERFYFVGYSVFTMGNGDFTPRDGVPQIATALMTASGMLFVTLSVTYVLSVLGAVTQKRSFASGVSGLGERGSAVLRTSWDRDDEEFLGLEVPLDTLATQLNTLASNHKAYPILHYFYATQPGQAATRSVVILDETLTLLGRGVSPAARPGGISVTAARSSVEGYLDTVGDAFVDPADDVPPPPGIESLREAGIPTVSDETFARELSRFDDRRRTLLGLVESDARQWPADDAESTSASTPE
ncbi:ion channel [Halosimplex sp. J119]